MSAAAVPAPVPNPAPAAAKPGFACDFCHRVLPSEKRLFAHLCRAKKRALQRDERFVTIGFQAYLRFWERRMTPKRRPGWDDFDASSLYMGFIRFGRYVLAINAINPPGFVEFLLKAEVGLDKWCHGSYYQAYIREMTKLESPWEALERNILLMQQWAADQQMHWTDFFRAVATPQAVLWILSGRISPWLLCTAETAHELFKRLTPEQEAAVAAVIDEGFWQRKMERHADAVTEIIATLAEYRI